MSDQPKKTYQPSKPGAVGKDMAGSLKGDRDDEGGISTNYKGRPGNAIPGYNPDSVGQVPVSNWTKDRMQQSREDAKAKREEQ